MEDVFIHPHALKHGVAEAEILRAWTNFVKSQYRATPHEDQCVRIGYGSKLPTAIQMIGIRKPFGVSIVHAVTPPQKSVLKELGIHGRVL